MVTYAAPAVADPLPPPPFAIISEVTTMNPLAQAGHILEKRMNEVRCALPDARVFGNLSVPGAEVCLTPDGVVRVCLGARVSLRGDWHASSASIFVTDRPAQRSCPKVAHD
jgi:hypothetical protein